MILHWYNVVQYFFPIHLLKDVSVGSILGSLMNKVAVNIQEKDFCVDMLQLTRQVSDTEKEISYC